MGFWDWATAITVPVVVAAIVVLAVLTVLRSSYSRRGIATAIAIGLAAAAALFVAFRGGRQLAAALLTLLGAIAQVLAVVDLKRGVPYAKTDDDKELLQTVGWSVILLAGGTAIWDALD